MADPCLRLGAQRPAKRCETYWADGKVAPSSLEVCHKDSGIVVGEGFVSRGWGRRRCSNLGLDRNKDTCLAVVVYSSA